MTLPCSVGHFNSQQLLFLDGNKSAPESFAGDFEFPADLDWDHEPGECSRYGGVMMDCKMLVFNWCRGWWDLDWLRPTIHLRHYWLLFYTRV